MGTRSQFQKFGSCPQFPRDLGHGPEFHINSKKSQAGKYKILNPWEFSSLLLGPEATGFRPTGEEADFLIERAGKVVAHHLLYHN